MAFRRAAPACIPVPFPPASHQPAVLFRVFLAVLFRSHCHFLNIPQVHAYSATITGGPVPSYAGRSLSAGSSCVNSRAVPLLPCTNRQFSYGPFSRYYVAVVAINFRLRLLYRALFRLSTGKYIIFISLLHRPAGARSCFSSIPPGTVCDHEQPQEGNECGKRRHHIGHRRRAQHSLCSAFFLPARNVSALGKHGNAAAGSVEFHRQRHKLEHQDAAEKQRAEHGKGIVPHNHPEQHQIRRHCGTDVGHRHKRVAHADGRIPFLILHHMADLMCRNGERRNGRLVKHRFRKANRVGFGVEVVGQRAGNTGKLRVAAAVKEHALRYVTRAQAGSRRHVRVFPECALHAGGGDHADHRNGEYHPQHGIIIKIRHCVQPFPAQVFVL